MKCPQCQTEAAQVGTIWICPNHGQLPEVRPFAPLRIFLSYGHDSNVELVRRIKADLEKRGHDVWFDQNEIKFGDDWRRAITDGIVGSNRVLSFLSKHSTRDPGVCRDEIAIAIGVKGGNIQTILVESEQEVQPPVNIGHIQWLDMHDWKERKERGSGVPPEHPDSWEQWYQAKLAEIIRVVESDESRRFAGEIETLNGHLKTIKSDARIYNLLKKGFFGRAWLFEAVEQWRTASQGGPCGSHRLFWITGDPGVGKSAFAAQLTHTRSDAVIAAQFVEWDKPDHRDARRVIRSLAFQLATRLPDYRKLLLTLPEIAELDRKDPAELFDYLLANPLRSVIGGGRERYLIVIDALDEAGSASSQGEAGRNPLVEMLARNAQRLPDWLGLVVTSRPESAVKTPLQGLNPFVLDTRTEANRADLRDYLRHQLAPQLQNRPDAGRLIEQILEKSEGVFLYVEHFCDDLQQNHLSLDRPEQFPQGLGGIFCQWFQRQFPDLEKFRKDVRPALRAILAAREPLPVEILQRLFHWQDEELHDFIRTLGSLFPAAKEANGEVIKPYHKSLADWLTDEAKAGTCFVSLKEGHRILAESGWGEFEKSSNIHRYFVAHLPSHLLACTDWLRASLMLTDIRFLENKIGGGFAFELLLDFQHTKKLIPRDALESRLLELIEVALRRHVHFIARHAHDYPQALFQCLWNTCWWHDRPPAALSPDSITQRSQLESAVRRNLPDKLYQIVEQWRRAKQQVAPSQVWVRSLLPPLFPLNSPVARVFAGHKRAVCDAKFSPDGNWIASSSLDGTVRLWNADTGREMFVWPGNQPTTQLVSNAPRVSFVGDGYSLIIGWSEGRSQVFDIMRGDLLAELDERTGSVKGASIDLHRDLRSKQLSCLLPVRDSSGMRVSAIELSPRGDHILAIEGPLVFILESATVNLEPASRNPSGSSIRALEYSPDGARIATVTGDRDLRIWNSANPTEFIQLLGHSDPIWMIKFWASGDTLVSVSAEGTPSQWEVRTWDVKTGQCRYVSHGISEEDEDYMHTPNYFQTPFSLSDDDLETRISLAGFTPGNAFLAERLGWNGRVHPRLPQIAGAIYGELVVAFVERIGGEL